MACDSSRLPVSCRPCPPPSLARSWCWSDPDSRAPIRSRRLTILGKRFGCVALTMLAIAKREEAFPSPWSSLVLVWLRVHLEGGVCALVASLLPYPRLATRDARFRLKVGGRRSSGDLVASWKLSPLAAQGCPS